MCTRGSWDISTGLKCQAVNLWDECRLRETARSLSFARNERDGMRDDARATYGSRLRILRWHAYFSVFPYGFSSKRETARSLGRVLFLRDYLRTPS